MPRISELPEADPLVGTEQKVVVQGGVTKRGASGVRVFWFDAGANASAARPAEAAATDIVIWTNVPSEPTNLGARDQWEDAS